MNLPDGNRQAPKPQAVSPASLEIILIGVNHRTAPVELREKLGFTAEETESLLTTLRKLSFIQEVLLVSTCNRVEVLITTDQPKTAREMLSSYIAEWKSIPASKLESAVYVYSGNDAIRHVFRVTASLDSMMLGEPQILGQVKAAYRSAVETKTAGVILNRLLHKAFSIAKRVRKETGIGGHAVSISYAAIELAKKIFDSLADKSVLMVGAGEMAELAVEHLIRSHHSGNIFVANRTFSMAVELAGRFNGTPLRFEEIHEALPSVDIIVSSTGAPDYVIRRDHVKPIMRRRKNRPLFFIDIAVPRDIDPAINRIPNAYLYDIDDLQGVIDENIKIRHKESVAAERIIDEGVIRFRNWYENLDVVPTIVALREKLHAIAAAELNKTLHSLDLSEAEQEALKKMTEAMVKKMLHDPTMFLKNPGSHRNKSAYLDLTRNLFKLDDEIE
ncbi:MAG: glutamyl-tRNA reductase [Desulfobacterales bacterium]|nr:glutamyl-tRNA reductase [Desulfobacterales bacterium]